MGDGVQCQEQVQLPAPEAEVVLPAYYSAFVPAKYDEYLEDKVNRVKRQFSALVREDTLRDLTVIPSEPSHFRLRCRFGIILDGGVLSYGLYENGALSFKVESFPVASKRICTAMPTVLEALQNSASLKEGIRAVHFLSSLSDQILVTLVYDCPLGSAWSTEAASLQRDIDGSVLGRSKGALTAAGPQHITESLTLADGRTLLYKQVEGSFSNPNGRVNEGALNWLCRVATTLPCVRQDAVSAINLLELYCGNGNHTVALSGYFARVVAVELNKDLCAAADINLGLNNVKNARVMQVHSEKFCRNLLRRKNVYVPAEGGEGEGEALQFDVVLVDPPRAGLDNDTLSCVGAYDFIFYISCNPEALLRDLSTLVETHTVECMAVFDQFAYTDHVECGVYLKRRV